MTDLEYEDLLPLLSMPAAAHDPDGLSRRRFLQGMLVTAGAAGLQLGFAGDAFGATPIGNGDGILVAVMLGGGNDGLNTLAPISGSARSRYNTLRGPIAIPAAQLLPAAGGWGFHPRLAKLSDRFAAGRVAVVQGVGQMSNDLSHFTSMATWMAGSTSPSRSTGWLGRFLDGVTEYDSGLRGAVFSSSVPLHLLGQQAKVTAFPEQGGMWGADPSDLWEADAFAAVRGFAASPTGLSQWGDRVAANGRAAIDMARTAAALYEPEVTTEGLVKDLTLAARLVNANLGVRVIGVSLGSFDTHANQLYDQGELLGELDAGIEAFFKTLGTAWKDQTTLVTFSEFGRRPEHNDSAGTDHGTASVMLVVGENVKGGLAGAAPSLTAFDDRDNFVPTVDFRSVYATLLDKWLDGDPAQILGGTFETLDLFTNVPGGPRTVTPPPPPPNPAAPFADWTALVRQQYADILLITAPASTDVATWVSRLQGAKTTPVDLIVSFMGSQHSVNEVEPVLRGYQTCFGRVPTFRELTINVNLVRSKGLAAVLTGFVGSVSFRARNGTLDDAAFVKWLYRTMLGTTPTAERVAHWKGELTNHHYTRGTLATHFMTTTTAVARWKNQVLLAQLFAGMVHAVPSSASWSTRLARLGRGRRSDPRWRRCWARPGTRPGSPDPTPAVPSMPMTAPTQDERRRVRREELLDAAITAIRDIGPGATMEQLARAGGVTKPILYRHFRDRDGLIAAIADRYSSDLLGAVAPPLQADTTARDLLRNTIDSYVGFIERETHLYRFLVQHPPERRPSGPHLSSLIDAVAHQVAGVAGERLHEAGRDRGAAVPWAYGIVGLVHQAGGWWVDDQTMTRSTLVDHLTTLLWDGLKGPDA